jgi:hypothetical protein
VSKKKKFKELPVGELASVEYERARWKHYLHWLLFSAVVFLYLLLILSSYSSHVLHHHGFMLQELIIYVICTLMMIPVLPGVILEVDYVRVDPEEVVFQNLLLRRIERWENLIKFDDPVILKFAILRSKDFVYLLNRRDIPDFGQLVDTIKEKAVNLKK